MSDFHNEEDMLAAILAEDSPAGFREAMLGETLRMARGRRRFRQGRRAIAVCAVAGLLAICIWRQWPAPAAASRETIAAAPVYTLVLSRPLPASEIVATVSGGYRTLNDDQLLGLVAGEPAALVRTGPGSEELVFAKAGDEKRFRAN